MVGGVDFLVAFVAEHLDTAEDKYDAEDGEYPAEASDQCSNGEDEDETHDDGTEDAPEEYAVVVFLVDAEADENHDHDEDVVDGERLFEEIAGKVLLSYLAAIDGEGGFVTA